MSHHLKTTALVLATLLPTTALADWTGGYAGLTFGSNINNDFAADTDIAGESAEVESKSLAGAFGGYQVQSGDFVFGGEVAFSRVSDAEIEIRDSIGRGDIDIIDLKGRVGFAVDSIMFYGIAGFSTIGGDVTDTSGLNFGVGAGYDVGNNFVISAEYLARRTSGDDETEDDMGDVIEFDLDVEVDTFVVRAAFAF